MIFRRVSCNAEFGEERGERREKSESIRQEDVGEGAQPSALSTAANGVLTSCGQGQP